MRRRGMALATALLVTLILLVLGMAFLYFIERDYRFAGAQERSQEAFYLALCGLTYAGRRPDLVPLGGAAVKGYVPAGSANYFEVSRLADGRLHSRGVVGSAGNASAVLAERSVELMPGGVVHDLSL